VLSAAGNRRGRNRSACCFIGNSLTYVNDVPALVQAIGKANGEKVETRMVAYPDYSLEDHWNGGDARRARAGRGRLVVSS